MGVYSEMDLDMQYGSDSPFASDDEVSAPEQAAIPAPQAAAPAASAQARPPQAQSDADTKKKAVEEAAAKRKAEDDAKRKAHEESEAKRKAEWEAEQQATKAVEQKQLDKLAAMSADELMMAATKRLGDDLEKLTRRSMKEYVTEHIQTKCLDNPDFALKVLHPRKNMVHCFWYINRKAQEFLLKEMEMNGEKPKPGERIGGDVPDDICYQWAEDYFNDPNAEEDKDKNAKFVPKPYYGGSSSASSKKKETAKKKEPAKSEPKKPDPAKSADIGQMTLGDFGPLKESA